MRQASLTSGITTPPVSVAVNTNPPLISMAELNHNNALPRIPASASGQCLLPNTRKCTQTNALGQYSISSLSQKHPDTSVTFFGLDLLAVAASKHNESSTSQSESNEMLCPFDANKVKESKIDSSSNVQPIVGWETGFQQNSAVSQSHEPKKPKNFVCDFIINTDTNKICGKAFSWKSYLDAHKITHSDEKPFFCDLCHKRFKRKDSIRIHYLSVHTGNKSCLCEICGKWSTYKHYTAHRLTHTGEKPYLCDICDKGFITNSKCVTHRRIHTGEKPYLCDLCGKGFADSSNYAAHRRRHTGD